MSHEPKSDSEDTVAVMEQPGKSGFFGSLSKNQVRILIVAVFVVLGGGFILAKAATTSYSLWPNNPIPRTITSSSSSGAELGVKFKSRNSGHVTGIRFYKGAQNTGNHIGSLWDNKGNLLASVTFKNETNSGWQTASFDQPIIIAANVVYVASYYAPNGHYSVNSGYFNNGSRRSGPLLAPREGGSSGANGVYINSSSPVYPTQDKNGANYWVDVVFSTSLIAPPSAPAPPSSVTAVQSGASVVVTWNTGISSNSVASYQVIRNGSVVATVPSANLSYSDSSVVAGQTYNYQIKTVDSTAATSVASVTATITYNVTPPVTCPAGTTGTPPNCVPTSGGGSGTGSGSGGGGTTAGGVWQPAQNTPWMWEIGTTLDITNAKLMGTGVTAYNGSTPPGNDPVIYDIDGVDTPASTVAALHAQGKKVICYMTVGTIGDYYTAAAEGIPTTYYAQMQAAGALGSKLSGYPEYFVNINSAAAVSILESMINQQCKGKGFDGVETDLDETFGGNEGNAGFTITQSNEETFLTTLANYMHGLGLSWFAKNLDDTSNSSFVGNMQPLAQGMISEECNYNGTCSYLSPFLSAGKWIGNAEYTTPDGETTAKFCPYDNANNINGVLFDASASLAGGRSPCR